ncbi:Mbov_0397 family ICE element conjugal transfer ATPase [Mycoplasma sp. CSL7503-lung]|uniref:Mbov_0397 family ICE element conjugal transfer ATPase n=1 Tax=Mycoplasma sp. CSL7503-lung TaxID=536372 RepID=UPI0021D38869|nr:DUF87 domain-containing protein [Mycoplasma sp. CSL7503-lung]MCU4706433.1 DUF87 domain-containing protein [Mycoplasma sp. CSL7503-lung]
MLQPNRLKNRKTKISRFLTMQDAIELIVVIGVAFGISYLLFSDYAVKWAIWASFLAISLPLLILILPSKRINNKIYVYLWRALVFWISPKKYNKNGKNKVRNSLELNPFSHIYEDDIVINKKVLGDKLVNKKDVFFNCFGVFKINGFNLWAEDKETRDAYIENFARTLDIFKNKYSIIKLDENISYDKNIDFIKNKAFNNELLEEYNNSNLNDFRKINTDLLSEQYYLIINGHNPFSLNEEASNVVPYFEDIKVSLEKLEGIDLLEFLNKYRNFGISSERIKDFWIKLDKTSENYLDDLFLYDNVEFYSNHIKLNDSFISIKSIARLPFKLNESWISSIFNLDAKVIINNYPYKSLETVVDKMLDKTHLNVATNLESNNKISSNIRTNMDSNAITELLFQINESEYTLNDVNILVITEASSLNELKEKEKNNEMHLRKSRIYLNNLLFKQFEGFVDSSLSISYKLDKEAYQMSSLNFAYGYAFNNEILNDNKNLLLGFNESSNNPISFDIFSLQHLNRTNHNMFILGTSGMGKSTLVKKMIISNYVLKNKSIIIDPQNEYTEFAKKFGGTVIDMGSGLNTTINILQVRNTLKDNDGLNNINLLINNHLSFLEKFFSILWELDNYNWMILQNLLKDFYVKKGIYQLNSLTDLSDNDWYTISDFIKFLESYNVDKMFDKDQKQKIINRFIEQFKFYFEDNGKYQEIFNGKTNLILDNDLIVFNMINLTSTNDTISAKLGILIVLNICNEIIYNNFLNNEKILNKYKKDNNLKILDKSIIDDLITRTLLVIDEEHIYIDAKNTITLDYITNITKTIRKFDGGTIHTTQNPGDYKANPMIADSASRIIQNCNYSIFFGLKDDDIDAVQLLYKNSSKLLKNEIKYLAQKQAGKILFSVNNNQRFKVNVYYSELEKELFFKKGF